MSEKDEIPEAVRAWYSKIGKKGGKNCMSHEKRVIMGKLTSARGWAKRRKKYGWHGYDIKKRKKVSQGQVKNSLITSNPDIADHPVWKES